MYTNRGCNSGENIYSTFEKNQYSMISESVSENQFNIVFNNKIYTIKMYLVEKNHRVDRFII